MKENYPQCYKFVRQFEGGNDDDPHDPGGRTSRGIIQREWNAFRKTHPGRPSDVWKASEEDVATIYHDGIYWTGQRLDDALSGLDETLFDYGVNSGPGRSQKVLRRCLHLPENASGPIVNAKLARLTAPQLKLLIEAINDERLAFLRRLPTFARFGGGWTKRVKQVRAISLHFAETAAMIPTPVPQSVIGEATVAENNSMPAKGTFAEPEAARNGVKAAAASSPVVGAGAWDWVYAHQVETAIIGVCLIVIVAAIFKGISVWHKSRQEAAPVGWTPPAELKAA